MGDEQESIVPVQGFTRQGTLQHVGEGGTG